MTFQVGMIPVRSRRIDDEPLCGRWPAILEVVRNNRHLSLLASKTEIHVWNADNPRLTDKCQCGALTWAGIPSADR
jgi:hypothetical protein